MNKPIPSYEFCSFYEELLFSIWKNGLVEKNSRTGKQVKILPQGGVAFSLMLQYGILPVVANRKTFPSTAAAEMAWFLQGTQDASFMMQHAPVVWGKFLEPIKPLSDKPQDEFLGIKAAYGYRWRTHFGRDQLLQGMRALLNNPSDRRVYISAWDPAQDGLGQQGQLNVPCPVGFTLSIQDKRLYSTILLRSSDVFVGLPYDVMGHAMLMDSIAATLQVGLGNMTVVLANAHLYDVHWDMAERSFHDKQRVDLRMPKWPLSQVSMDPAGYVAEWKDISTQPEVKWPKYCPRPEVVE